MFNTIRIIRSTLMLVLLLSVAACGFHLRGTTSLFNGDQSIFVVARDSAFSDKLNDALIGSGALLTADAEGAGQILQVTQAKHSREVGTLDNRGIVSSYKLKFTVTYSVSDASGQLLREPQVLTEDRHYVFVPGFVVESEQEQQALKDSMESDVALRLVRQLSTLNGQ